jgi:hypothetical protein
MIGMIDIKKSSNSNTSKESFEDIVDGHFCDKSHIQLQALVIA